MIIGGIQKLTLLDYPEKVACTVFTYGCNLRCPFCHNKALVTESATNVIQEQQIYDFLKTRKGILDAVCISGGEPFLNLDIIDFAKNIKEMGFLVKVDTNGTFPERLEELCNTGYIDYVAMDIKNSIDKYTMTCGIDKIVVGKVMKSVSYLMSQDKVDYEFRTTCTETFHTEEDIDKIASWIKGCNHYYLQKYLYRESVIDKTCLECSNEKMKDFLAIAQRHIPNTKLRGVE
jgi:pyruvate formate lyase activating enzyme